MRLTNERGYSSPRSLFHGGGSVLGNERRPEYVRGGAKHIKRGGEIECESQL